MSQKNNYQWESTDPLLSYLCYLAQHDPEALNQLMQTQCFASEKFDGTNIGKDDLGTIYSRRLVLGKDEDKFLHTSLDNVKEADVQLLKKLLLKNLAAEEIEVRKFVVFGEFICNRVYDYVERGLIGKWLIFGVKIECSGEAEGLLRQKLDEKGFSLEKSVGHGQIKILPCLNLHHLVAEAKMDVAKCLESGATLVEVIAKYREVMRKGQLEGIVITMEVESESEDNRKVTKMFKWKGPQQHQPGTQSNFLAVNEKIQKNIKVDDGIKTAFQNLATVIEDTSENIPAQRMLKKLNKVKLKLDETEELEETSQKRTKFLTKMHKVNIFFFSVTVAIFYIFHRKSLNWV